MEGSGTKVRRWKTVKKIFFGHGVNHDMSLKLLKKKNYLTMIENSAKGENWMFRNLYAEIDGKARDIVNNGQESCALFVTAILYLFKLVNGLHATVNGTVKDLFDSGWREISDMKLGSVLIWENKDFDDGPHGHIGFYVGDNMAVSNSSFDKGVPVKHHYTYNDTRKIEKILWHPFLDEN